MNVFENAGSVVLMPLHKRVTVCVDPLLGIVSDVPSDVSKSPSPSASTQPTIVALRPVLLNALTDTVKLDTPVVITCKPVTPSSSTPSPVASADVFLTHSIPGFKTPR